MKKHLYEGVIVKRVSQRCSSAKEFKAKHPNVFIDALDGHEIVAMCESCGEVIRARQKFNFDTEGCYWHKLNRDCKLPKEKK